ncbi:MAG: NAD-glutamate dehydrogenase [Proteobacteria bacterium]|nr:NAD-glutamate dehydrogenase [Pseudomonadota bacterium]
MADHAEAVRAILEVFRLRFDPDIPRDEEAVAVAHANAHATCDAIERLDHDRIVRGILDLVDATLRTTAYIHTADDDDRGWTHDADGRRVPVLAFKFDPSRVPDAPAPLPRVGLYHPDLPGTPTLAVLRARHRPEVPTVGILFYRAHLLAGNIAFVDALVREVERRGANALPVFSVGSKEEAGADGALPPFLQPFAEAGCDALISPLVSGETVPFVFVTRSLGLRILNQTVAADPCAQDAPAIGGDTADVDIRGVFDGWGYVHLFDAQTMEDLDQYAIDEALDPRFATGFGDLSVHEVAMSQQSNGLGYVSYYAAGLRIIDVSTGKIVEKGAFIDEGGNNFWGVETFTAGGKEYVAASDRDLGLYLYEYTPVNAAP